jgi:hypothetical protein
MVAHTRAAAGLAAHTYANRAGVRLSVRGRVSMGALRQEKPQPKAVQGKWSTAGPTGLATAPAVATSQRRGDLWPSGRRCPASGDAMAGTSAGLKNQWAITRLAHPTLAYASAGLRPRAVAACCMRPSKLASWVQRL